ncbi:MAG: bifunctional glycosyltransferase family 2/GtrA family protein [Erysipelotrichaceae bacterium]|nr:bifunctional glycosyltransferase family 2/GtrA family protein [Erysipelotrichaceae bacterium]
MTQKIALIPAFEPQNVLIKLVDQLANENYRVIIVDDGSGKNYKDIFDSLKSMAEVVTHTRNLGKGCAIKTGLTYINNHLTGDYIVVTLDADGQHKVQDVEAVTQQAIKKRGELVLGTRCFKNEVPLRSRFGNTITRLVFYSATGVRVSDTQTGLRAFDNTLLPFMLTIKGDRYEYEMNVLLESTKAKITMAEVPIETVYFDNNAGSHFHTIRDSFLVYRKILAFAGSSVISFITDYFLYTILVVLTGSWSLTVSIPFANVMARVVSASLNYSLNKHFVFQNKDKLTKTAVQYFLLAALIMIGNTVLLSLMVDGLGINKYLAKLVTELSFFILSWAAQRYLIFKVTSPKLNPNLNNKELS